jgi:hypothetical protein
MSVEARKSNAALDLSGKTAVVTGKLNLWSYMISWTRVDVVLF